MKNTEKNESYLLYYAFSDKSVQVDDLQVTVDSHYCYILQLL